VPEAAVGGAEIAEAAGGKALIRSDAFDVGAVQRQLHAAVGLQPLAHHAEPAADREGAADTVFGEQQGAAGGEELHAEWRLELADGHAQRAHRAAEVDVGPDFAFEIVFGLQAVAAGQIHQQADFLPTPVAQIAQGPWLGALEVDPVELQVGAEARIQVLGRNHEGRQRKQQDGSGAGQGHGSFLDGRRVVDVRNMTTVFQCSHFLHGSVALSPSPRH
jgi:hypothetical protein